MKSSLRLNKKNIIIIGTFIILLVICTYSLNNDSNFKFQDNNSKFTNLKTSKITGGIHINNNWSAAIGAGLATGLGTYPDPYIIEDKVIDGNSSGYCLWIENSSVYFRIENCTFYNSGHEGYYWPWGGGIVLSNVSNSFVINNNASNNYEGTFLENSNNNTISGNILSNNYRNGIHLLESYNNTISSNNASSNHENEISLEESYNITLSGNMMNESGLLVSDSLEHLISHNIDTTNLVSNKPLYYYINKNNFEPIDFSNAGQVIIVNSTDSHISNINVSHVSMGISIYYGKNNTITGNIANNCSDYGISIFKSDDNIISGNNASHNDLGIKIEECAGNNITGNRAYYNRASGMSFSDLYQGNLIQGNTVNYNEEGGIRLDGCFNNIVSENTMIYNGDSGLDLENSDDNLILGNNVTNGEFLGIRLSNSNLNNISSNIINFNRGEGILFYGGDHNTILGNIVKYNGGEGIYFYYNSNYNSILDNTVSNNGGTGILIGEDYGSGSNDNNIILGNNASFNTDSGIYIVGGSDNTISENIISFNNLYGIFLRECGNNEIRRNTINDNSVGIGLLRSDNNVVSENVLFGNFECLREIECVGNTFIDNSICIPDRSPPDENPNNPAITGFIYISLGIIAIVILLLSNKKRKK